MYVFRRFVASTYLRNHNKMPMAVAEVASLVSMQYPQYIKSEIKESQTDKKLLDVLDNSSLRRCKPSTVTQSDGHSRSVTALGVSLAVSKTQSVLLS